MYEYLFCVSAGWRPVRVYERGTSLRMGVETRVDVTVWGTREDHDFPYPCEPNFLNISESRHFVKEATRVVNL